MTRDELLKSIRNHTGEVCVGMVSRSDVIYVKVVKSDLLKVLDNIGDNELRTNRTKGTLYVDSYI